MMQRVLFQFATGAGAIFDTGPPVVGALSQLRYDRTAGDTGGSIELSLLLTDTPGDTGSVVPLFTIGLLPTGWIKAPRLLATHPDGFDTGRTVSVPAVANGERLRLKVTPGNTGVSGRLWCWVKQDD